MSKINIRAIDKAIFNCFDGLGLTDAHYVIVVHHDDAAAIGTNIGKMSGAEALLGQALLVMDQREPDICELVSDDIGPVKGRA